MTEYEVRSFVRTLAALDRIVTGFKNVTEKEHIQIAKREIEDTFDLTKDTLIKILKEETFKLYAKNTLNPTLFTYLEMGKDQVDVNRLALVEGFLLQLIAIENQFKAMTICSNESASV
jgi:hypothetical protein